MLSYRVILDVPLPLVLFVSGLLAATVARIVRVPYVVTPDSLGSDFP